MTYDPQVKTRAGVLRYFARHKKRFPGVAEKMEAMLTAPSLKTVQALMEHYFALRPANGDLHSLRTITSLFADKRLVKNIVESIIEDDAMLEDIASKSYPHPIGFDKLVLHNDPTGAQLRLHVYWRGNSRIAEELTHLHRWDMASAIVTGELDNEELDVVDFIPANDFVKGMETSKARKAKADRTFYAYSGYRAGENGQLHKTFLGVCRLRNRKTGTYVSGQSYAQTFTHAHYVATNAERGQANADTCSTIYVHTGNMVDKAGRSIPVLFEESKKEDDTVIERIPSLTKETLKASLIRYRDHLDENLKFYEWLTDPKHGRDLSVGMIAGYLLSRSYGNPHTISQWIDHEKDSKEMLRRCMVTLEKLIKGEIRLKDLSDNDREKRYYAILLDKAAQHPDGKLDWLEKHGNLIREMWRYCGAIKGEFTDAAGEPDLTLLKPMWKAIAGRKLPGGAHYGHVAAMIEAAFDANKLAMKYFVCRPEARFKPDGTPVSVADIDIEKKIHDSLAGHYPGYGFKGEESGDNTNNSVEGDCRWLVDPIDGTSDFLKGRTEFCISIACQEYRDGAWETTDGLVSMPVEGKIFWAEKGKGAYLIERNDFERRLRIDPAAAPDPAKPLDNGIVDVSIRGFGAYGEVDLIKAFRAANVRYRAIGPVAKMLAMISDRNTDGVIVTANDWDMEAGMLIATEAGATVSQFEFTRGPQRYIATVASPDKVTHDALRIRAMHAGRVASRREPPTPVSAKGPV